MYVVFYYFFVDFVVLVFVFQYYVIDGDFIVYQIGGKDMGCGYYVVFFVLQNEVVCFFVLVVEIEVGVILFYYECVEVQCNDVVKFVQCQF